MPSLRLVALLLLAALVAVGCGREVQTSDPEQPALIAPPGKERANLGFPELATKNTTRVPSSDPTQIAAAVARAVFADPARPPDAVALVDRGDWRVAIAAAALMGPPFKSPILFTDKTSLPGPSRSALSALKPAGSDAAGKAQIIRIGNVARPAGYKTSDVAAGSALAMTRSIAGLIRAGKPGAAAKIIVTSAEDGSFAAPAAGYAALSGNPVLFVNRYSVPPETRAALAALSGLARARMFVLGPSSVISPKVTRELRRFGTVRRVGGQNPITNAIAFARYRVGEFGWGVSNSGHGMVFARAEEPLQAAAAAPLSSAGSYGPLFLLDSASTLPDALQGQLLDTQPAYRTTPVAAVYNRGWIIGDRSAISVPVQTRIDALLEVAPEQLPGNLDSPTR
jgi:hypothetical protein